MPAHATADNPGYTMDNSAEQRSGDWYLLCDEDNDCAIVGTAKTRGKTARYRALILLNRANDLDANWLARLVLLDDAKLAEVNEAMPQTVHAYIKSPANMRPPVVLTLPRDGGPAFFLTLDQGARLIELLALGKRAEIRDQGVALATLPRGNLRKLLNRADRQQRTHIPQLDPSEAEFAALLPRFNYDVFPARDYLPASKPKLERPCGDRTENRSRTWELTQGSRLWLVDCPAETRVFREFAGKPPERLNLTDLQGKLYQPRSVEFDPDTGLMTMSIRTNGRADCGHRVTWGWTGAGDFQLLIATSMPLCRNIPDAFWPTRWGASGWRIVGRAPPHNSPGDCAPEPDIIDSKGLSL
ncbi:MAG: DUF1176 domain-containing protein [Pontixanthobacter sp.]